MATRYVTLKDSNGDTIYPQSVIAQVANGEITGDLIANNTITSDKLKGFLTANTTDTWVPVTTGTGEIQHRVIAPLNADGTIPTSAIADGAVTDAKLAAPHWKVVSVVNSNSWVIPAGYRFYRVYMAASANTGGNIAYICVNGKIGDSYSTGPYTEGTSTYSYVDYWPGGNIVGYADTVGVSGGGHGYNININIARDSTSHNWYRGYYTSSGSGADWVVQGKLEFSASDNFNFYIDRAGSSITDCFGYVEALVE